MFRVVRVYRLLGLGLIVEGAARGPAGSRVRVFSAQGLGG